MATLPKVGLCCCDAIGCMATTPAERPTFSQLGLLLAQRLYPSAEPSAATPGTQQYILPARWAVHHDLNANSSLYVSTRTGTTHCHSGKDHRPPQRLLLPCLWAGPCTRTHSRIIHFM